MANTLAVAALLLGLYGAVVLLAAGFALMLGGPLWFRSTLRYLFVRPIRGLGLYFATRFRSWLRQLRIGVVRNIVDPLARAAVKIFDRLLFSRRR